MQETPLRQIIDQAGRIPPEQALDIAARAARAIDVIHENDDVHGAIGPDAVLVGPQGTVTIDESGLSAEASTTTTHELDAAVVAYFSPEQTRGLEIDQPSDLYSLGVVLFEMLTGSVPFQASSPMAVAYEHATVPPPRLDEIDPEIPSHVADTVDKALAKDPADRYQSGSEMASALAAAREELVPTVAPVSSVSAVTDGPSAAAAATGRRWPRVAMASFVLLLAAVSTAGILPMLPASERSPGNPSADGAAPEEHDGSLEAPLAGDGEARPDPRSGDSGPGGDTTPPSTGDDDASPTTTSPFVTTAPTTTTTAPTMTTQPTSNTTTTAPTTTTTAPTTSTSGASTTTTTKATTTTTESTTTTAPTATTTVPTSSTTESQP